MSANEAGGCENEKGRGLERRPFRTRIPHFDGVGAARAVDVSGGSHDLGTVWREASAENGAVVGVLLLRFELESGCKQRRASVLFDSVGSGRFAPEFQTLRVPEAPPKMTLEPSGEKSTEVMP